MLSLLYTIFYLMNLDHFFSLKKKIMSEIIKLVNDGMNLLPQSDSLTPESNH